MTPSRITPTVNVCFPRSGHRFLRNICTAYFGTDLVFRSAHAEGDARGDANYIKDHDFGVATSGGRPIDEGRQYLVQLRHPLESLQSYYEFRVRHGTIVDSRESWDAFLRDNLEYWKAFAGKWALSPLSEGRRLIVRYGDLYRDTAETASRVIGFLTSGKEPVSPEAVDRAARSFSGRFARYREDEDLGIRDNLRPRNAREFAYFDRNLVDVERRMVDGYLGPLGIEPLF